MLREAMQTGRKPTAARALIATLRCGCQAVFEIVKIAEALKHWSGEPFDRNFASTLPHFNGSTKPDTKGNLPKPIDA
jgi:hypothetical protein